MGKLIASRIVQMTFCSKVFTLWILREAFEQPTLGCTKNKSKTFSIDAGCCIHLQMQWIKFNNIDSNYTANKYIPFWISHWGRIFQPFPLQICDKTFLVWTFHAFIARALQCLQYFAACFYVDFFAIFLVESHQICPLVSSIISSG